MSDLVVTLERDNLPDKRMERYLVALESGEPSMSAACRKAKIAPQTIYRFRKEDGFIELENQAKRTGNDVVLDEIRRRGVYGDSEPVLDHKGNVVYARDLETGEFLLDDNLEKIPLLKHGKKSDRLLELDARIRGMIPGQGQSGSVEIETGKGGVPTKITVNFVDPPDWDKADEPGFWGDDGRPVMKNITPPKAEKSAQEVDLDFLDA